jgi:hypothetical protein
MHRDARQAAGAEHTVDAGQASSARPADWLRTQPRAPREPRSGGVSAQERQRRAFEGQLVSRMRAQARRRQALRAVAPSGSRSASVTGDAS